MDPKAAEDLTVTWLIINMNLKTSYKLLNNIVKIEAKGSDAIAPDPFAINGGRG
ncbi:hypothetical protein J2TS4_34330 [Paenibacillus sp. J2TS4]|nr:hypothetical protein J2TS4_34330 [Paenibacillus sp. J2TS4]